MFIYGQIQVSLFPEITFPKLKIIADNGEQPVDKMMVTVTRPLEDAIKQVPDLKILRSTTSRGTCEISIFLKWGKDINENLQILSLRVDEIKNQRREKNQGNVRTLEDMQQVGEKRRHSGLPSQTGLSSS